MSIDNRLTRLMPALTAKERAILILRSWKDGTPEDPLWRSTMPRDQSREFNRLIGLMNACNMRKTWPTFAPKLPPGPDSRRHTMTES